MIRRCHKRWYRTKLDAMIALADTKLHDGGSPRRREQRAYKCDICHRWHLTSRKKEDG